MNDQTTPKTYEDRRADFIRAVDLLGGQRKVAARLDIAERTMRDLVSGGRQIHDGFMREITALLDAHARECRELAKATDPLFTANRVPLVPRGRPAKVQADG
jgi:DNA-binding transcriptional regulator YdaS (Cro superfamily)